LPSSTRTGPRYIIYRFGRKWALGSILRPIFLSEHVVPTPSTRKLRLHASRNVQRKEAMGYLIWTPVHPV